MGSLATLADLTPTTAHEVETRHRALDPRCRHKQAKLEDEREARHAVVEALGLKLRALREELVVKRRRLADAIAHAAPEWSHGESAPGGGAGAIVTTGGFPDRAVREQEVARLAENLQHAEAAYQAAQARWASIARVVENCREWIQATPIAAIVPVVVPYERVPDPRREVETIRAKIITLGEEAAQVEGGPVSLADALARLDEQRRKVVERVAARRENLRPASRPRDGGLTQHGPPLRRGSHARRASGGDATQPGSVSPRATARSGGNWRRRLKQRETHASSPTLGSGGARSRPPRSPATRCPSPHERHGSLSLLGIAPSSSARRNVWSCAPSGTACRSIAARRPSQAWCFAPSSPRPRRRCWPGRVRHPPLDHEQWCDDD